MCAYVSETFNVDAPQQGSYCNMPNAVYHSAAGISSSQLRDMLRSPLHCWSRHIDPRRPDSQPTLAMQLGTAVHTAVLEPEIWEQEYVVAPKVDRRTKAGKEAWAAFQEKAGSRTVLTADQYDRAMEMTDAVHGHAFAPGLLCDGMAEVSVFHRDKTHDLLLKVRPDWWSERALVDLKTTTDASPFGFRRKVTSLQYHVQAAFYQDLIETVGGVKLPWYWIAAETEAPYAVAVYVADEDLLAEGRKLYKRALSLYAECHGRDSWPGYSDSALPLTLPNATRIPADEMFEDVEF